jgi:hypothetical protein
MIFRRLGFLLLLALGWPAPAAVTITFYSHELGSSFPHAFILLEGTPDAGGAAASGNYGFTAKHISPAILMGSVAGDIESASPGYVRNSQPHWRMTLSDGQYAAVLAIMAKWNAIPGKSYDLHRRNCVHFVGDVARTLGLDVTEPKALMQKPRSFLQSILARNTGLIVVGGGIDTMAVAAGGKSGARVTAVPTLRAVAPSIADSVLALSPASVAAAMAEGARDMSRGDVAGATPSALPR